MTYQVLPVYLHGSHAETQYYVAEESVTAKQILSGDDSGVVCLVLQPEKAGQIAELLNAARERATETPQKNT